MDTGKAVITTRKACEAGSYQTVRFRYTAGHPVDDTGCLKIVFRYVGDFGTPQFDDPSGSNFCTVRTDGDCRIEPRWDPKGHTRPWGKSLYLKVMGGYLASGESIHVVFGDTSNGSPGWQMQTFCEASFEFKTLVDPIASYRFKELANSPTLRITAGPPARAACIAPSQIETNRAFAYHLKLEDRWGNPVRRPRRLKHRGFALPGIHRVTASDTTTRLRATSNPIHVVEAPPELHPYWADFHGQSEETIGSNSIDDYFTFARDYSLLDISGHQGNDFQITDAFWTRIRKLANALTEAGRFVVFPGFEWSGNTPLGGDRNVYFAGTGGAITRSSNELLPDETSVFPVSPTADALFTRLASSPRAKPFAFAHVGGRYADMVMHDPAIELAVEIHSAWGTFEWLLEDALAHGYRVAVCANSDGHKGRPGSSYPGASRFGSYGGLTCVLAGSLDRAAIYAALKDRHIYATTGSRSLLEVRLTAADGVNAIMGDVIGRITGVPRLTGTFAGTAPVERVEIRNGTDVIKTIRPYSREDLGHRIKVIWSGAEVRGRARKVDWSGHLTVEGNTIKQVRAINFWNANSSVCHTSRRRMEWESITTGGIAGCILDLSKPLTGKLTIETQQGRTACNLGTLGIAGRIRRFGGLRKQLEIYALPDRLSDAAMTFDVPIRQLREGDNPIYIKAVQEDGHMAWSSPIYLVNNPAGRSGATSP